MIPTVEVANVTRMEWTLTVDAPVRAVYDTWTRFEGFPAFMEGVERVEQIDDTHLRWHVDVAGRRGWFDAEITEQVPDSRIAWRSTTEPEHAGSVDFHPLDDDRTEVGVTMDVSTDALPETFAGDGSVDARRFDEVVEADLHRFGRRVEHGPTPGGGLRRALRRGVGTSFRALDGLATAVGTIGALAWGVRGMRRSQSRARFVGRVRNSRMSGRRRAAYLAVGATGVYTIARSTIRTIPRMARREARI